MTLVALVVFVLLVVALSIGLFRLLRGKALRIENSDLDAPDKVHRLQRLLATGTLSVSASYFVIGGGGGAIAAAVGHHHHHLAATAAASLIGGVIVLVLAIATLPVLIVRAVRPSIARVRDVPMKAPDRKRRRRGALAVMVPYAVILGVGLFLIPRHGTGHAFGLLGVYLVGFFVLAGVIAPLSVVRFQTDAMPAEQRARLQQLADRLGVRVRDFRVLRGRSQKVANAAQLGVLPGLRYVVVTDYLVDHLSPEQLDAVVAHELGHAKRHHIAVKVGAVFGVLAVLELLAVLLGHTAGHTVGPFLIFPVLLAIPFGLILVQGLVGVRLEEAADDAAADAVGGHELAGALRAVGDLNDTKRDTGRVWSILTQHPGLQQRLDRLERTEPSGTPRPSRPSPTAGVGVG